MPFQDLLKGIATSVILLTIPPLKQEAAVDVSESERRLNDVFQFAIENLMRDALDDPQLDDLRMHLVAINRRVDVAVDKLIDHRHRFDGTRSTQRMADHGFRRLDEGKL